MKINLKKLSSTKLTRKEFLVYVGVVFIGILGIPTLLKLLTESSPNTKAIKLTRSNRPKVTGYGTGAYGV